MKHALIVDDSSAIRLVARRILERLEFEVVEAADTEAAYDACGRRSPDFIFLDLHIPGFVEFLGYQRSRLGGRQPKVLVCTVESDDPHLDGAFRAGADDFMLKPFDREVLEARLREIGVVEPATDTAAAVDA
jgi:two-component system, chemotaxis family, chemotaxis protein CheY